MGKQQERSCTCICQVYTLCLECMGICMQYCFTIFYVTFCAAPLLTGSCSIEGLSVFCQTSLDSYALVKLVYQCSYDSGPTEPCTLTLQLPMASKNIDHAIAFMTLYIPGGPNITIDETQFTLGDHNLFVSITTQSSIFNSAGFVVQFHIPGL